MGRFLFGIVLLIASAASQLTVAGDEMEEALSPGATAVFNNGDLPSEFASLVTRYRFENDGTGRKEVIARIRILNQMGTLQQSEQSFDYHPISEELQIPYVRVRKRDGNVVVIETDVVQRPPDGVTKEYDYDQRRVRIPGLAVGDLVEYDVIRVIRLPLGPGEFCVQHSFEPSIVDHEQLEIDVPGNRDVRVKNVISVESWQTNDGSRKVYHWENSSPGPHQVTAIPFVPGRTPDVQVSSFASWEQVGRWDSELTRRHSVPTPEVKAKADKLTNGLSSDIEKVEALYDFTAKKIRYVSLVSLGVGGYEPKSAAETMRDGYGDCKDKTALLIALLKAENLNASSVLVSADRKVDMDMPSPWPFDHAIAMVQLGKEEIWMDPSSAVLPFKMLVYPLRDKEGLVIPSEGTPYFKKTPVDPPVPNTWSEEIEGNLGENGTLDATVRITARGDAELPLRQALLTPSGAMRQWGVSGAVTGIDRNDRIADVKMSDPTVTTEPFTLSFRISRPTFLRAWGKQSSVELPLSECRFEAAGGEPTREWNNGNPTSVRLGPPRQCHYKIRIEFAKNFMVGLSPPLTLQSAYAFYNASYEVEHNVLSANRTLVTYRDELPFPLTEDYATFREQVMRDSVVPVTLADHLQ
jgi:hypothetical protein